MNENINLCEILKDTPKGTKLYTPIFGEVEFIGIEGSSLPKYPISVTKNGFTYYFTKEGYYSEDGIECLLFPSKDQRDWSKCQKSFVNGDIITSKAGGIVLFSHTQTHFECNNVVYYHCLFYPPQKFELGLNYGIGSVSDCRYATEEEKQKLFQAIKNNGYKWNTETKTLEKLIVPKFKVGDKIRHKTTNKDDIYEISKVYDDSYGLDGFTWMIYMKYQDNYELVPNKFDIFTLKPFDKVLVRNGKQDKWQIGLFSYLEEKKLGIDYGSYTKYFKSVTTYNVNSDFYYYCIPYNDNTIHLVGTTKEAPEFYQIEYETSLIN